MLASKQHALLGPPGELLRLLRLIADPEGLKAIIADIEAVHGPACEAYDRLAEGQTKHAATASDLAQRATALAAAESDFSGRAAAHERALAELESNRTEVERRRIAQAEAARKIEMREAALAGAEAGAAANAKAADARLTEAAQAKAEAEALLAHAQKTAADILTNAEAERGRLKGISDRLAAAAQAAVEGA